ncbi:MAG: HNH endonuclease [Gemmataceae bacterium]
MIDLIRPSEDEVRRLAYQLYEYRGKTDGWDVADWVMAERAARFHKNYERVQLAPFVSKDKVFLGTKEPRICRYCGKTKPAARFSKDAHAAPALLGNNSTFTYYECDRCNEDFGEYLEDHLAKMLHGARTPLMMSSRQSVPSYKTNRKLSRIDIENGQFKITQYVNDPMVLLDETSQGLAIDLETQPFIPLAVYKCLAKIGYSLLPDSELIHFTHTLHWIRERDHTLGAADFRQAFAHRIFCPGPLPSRYGWAELFRRRHDAIRIPYMALVVTSMNLTFQIYLPLCQKDAHLLGPPFLFPIYPAGINLGYDYGEPQIKSMKLSSLDRIKVGVDVAMHSEIADKPTNESSK